MKYVGKEQDKHLFVMIVMAIQKIEKKLDQNIEVGKMHFYHMYIVEASDADDAYAEVENRLEGYQYEVWDYYTVLNDDPKESIIKITKDNWQELFQIAEKKIAHSKNTLSHYKKRLIQGMKNKNILSFDELHIGDNSMLGFYLRRIGTLVSSYFCYDTYFFNWTKENPLITEEEFKEYAEKGGYYVVHMDLHN